MLRVADESDRQPGTACPCINHFSNSTSAVTLPISKADRVGDGLILGATEANLPAGPARTHRRHSLASVSDSNTRIELMTNNSLNHRGLPPQLRLRNEPKRRKRTSSKFNENGHFQREYYGCRLGSCRAHQWNSSL
jgi:hypothetical protein